MSLTPEFSGKGVATVQQLRGLFHALVPTNLALFFSGRFATDKFIGDEFEGGEHDGIPPILSFENCSCGVDNVLPPAIKRKRKLSSSDMTLLSMSYLRCIECKLWCGVTY